MSSVSNTMSLRTSSENSQKLNEVKNDLENNCSLINPEKNKIYNGLKRNISTHKLTSLKLIDLNLTELPKEIPELVNLHEMNLSGNNLETLPEKLMDASKLRIINLSRNKFVTIPDCLTLGLRTLKYINLSENFLHNFLVPPACLPLLKELILAHNFLHEIPDWILSEYVYLFDVLDLSFNPCFQLKKHFKIPPKNRIRGRVKTLKLNNTGFSVVSLGLLLYFPDLLSLDLGNIPNGRQNSLMNAVPDFIKEYIPSSLEEFYGQDIGLSCAPDLSFLKSLKTLDLSINALHWLPSDESLASNLRNINLSNTKLIILPDYIGNLTSLTQLRLPENDLSSLPTTFHLLINLEVLDLYNNSLQNMPELGSFSKLKAFDVCMNYFEPPAQPMGKDGPSYNDLKNSLRNNFHCTTRFDEPKDMDDEVSCSEDSSFFRSISPDCSNYLTESLEIIDKTEEVWELDNEDDLFDPTADLSYREEIYKKIQSRDFGKNCLKICPEDIKNSPHLFQPFEERSNSDCWKQACLIMKKEEDISSIIEGQFDDV